MHELIDIANLTEDEKRKLFQVEKIKIMDKFAKCLRDAYVSHERKIAELEASRMKEIAELNNEIFGASNEQ